MPRQRRGVTAPGTSAKDNRTHRRQAKRDDANRRRAGLDTGPPPVVDLDDLPGLAKRLRDQEQEQEGEGTGKGKGSSPTATA